LNGAWPRAECAAVNSVRGQPLAWAWTRYRRRWGFETAWALSSGKGDRRVERL